MRRTRRVGVGCWGDLPEEWAVTAAARSPVLGGSLNTGGGVVYDLKQCYFIVWLHCGRICTAFGRPRGTGPVLLLTASASASTCFPHYKPAFLLFPVFLFASCVLSCPLPHPPTYNVPLPSFLPSQAPAARARVMTTAALMRRTWPWWGRGRRRWG